MVHYSSLSRSEHELTPTTPAMQVPAQPVMADIDPWNDELIDMYRDQDDPVQQPPPPPGRALNDKPPQKPYAVSSLPSRAMSLRVAQKKRRTKRLVWIGIGAVALIAAGVGIGLGVALSKKHSSSGSSSGGSGGSKGAISGKTGSVVTMSDGTKFTYKNDFGGDWAADPQQPFSGGGKAQSWSPRVGVDEWKWGRDIVRGVNLGGWLVTEPFIVPALYEEFMGKTDITVVDEWTLSLAMGKNLASRMEQHYKTFITEQDFADIAAAGLNWVRIPIGFWAIEAINDEPFLVGTSWTYFLKAIEWGRKYGIRIFLDLHALPGSQNGWNHSGKAGTVNFMFGTMGIANAQRTLSYLRTIVEFVSQPQYKDVVPMVGLVNEILWGTIKEEAVKSFYYAAYETIRKSTGVGNGPYIAIHEGFQGTAPWAGFLAGSDRVVLDQHPYLAFMGDKSPISQIANKPCDWATATNFSSKMFGVTVGGEFSAAINNCGLWLNGVGSTIDDCDAWDNWSSYSAETIAGLKGVTLASMDALQNFFFWTWKIGNSTKLGTSSSPMWHYKLGMQQGWVPKDPREAVGHCAAILTSTLAFDGNYPSTATGGLGAGTLDPVVSASHPFPPATVLPSFSGTQVALMPTYTPTGTLKTLFAPTFTAAPKIPVGTGWQNPADNSPAYVPVKGCQYPNAWDANNVSLPATTCA